MKMISKTAYAAATLLAFCSLFAPYTNAQQTLVRYEVETSPATCAGTLDTAHSGYSGTAYCNNPTTAGAAVQFTVTASAAGMAIFAVRFANGSPTIRVADIVVNGATIHTGIPFASTGGWNRWDTRAVFAKVNAGSNTFRLVGTSTALPNIDAVDFAVNGPRSLENLGRGVVAVRSSSTSVLVTWRLLGLDPSGIGFNIYRATGTGSAVKLNSAVLTAGTNYLDSTVTLTSANTYHVRPVIGSVEQAASGTFILPANNAIEPVVRVPIKAGSSIKFVWVGDLDGDGEYDYVLDRQGGTSTTQKIEAYSHNGTFLWDVDLGPNSLNQNNIEPGSSTIDVGNWDGVTVFDFDADGKAEVALRIANGVRFGDGNTFTNSNNNYQFVAILDGQTGALRASAQLPTDYLSDGPLAARFGVGFLDGVRPHLVAFTKNRQDGGDFNLIESAWTFNGNAVKMEWKWLRGTQDAPDGHNTRIIDVNGDGKDEVIEIGFCLNGDGTTRYLLGPKGIIHGDRYHIAKMDTSRAGLQGYGVQQDHPSFLKEYYYDARDGTIIWKHFGTAVADVGRGLAGDIDPRYPGMEVWSFSGVYNARTNTLTETDTNLQPWPHLGLWWDGDVLMELYNDGKIEKWDWLNPTTTGSLPRIESVWNYGAVSGSGGVYPNFIGDIMGDWREEVILTNSAFDELVIFSTDIPSSIRLYTLAHNPAYRNAMTLKGYMQSHHVDYFLGNGMTTPPTPNIRYA